ncbi:unnamed protein product, partial [Symbiodinium necroappetens]
VYTVRVDNSYAVHLAGAKLPQPTLQVNDALVVPSDQDATWLSDQTGSTLKHLGAGPLLLNFSQENDGLELAFSSIIQAREIRIIGAKHITLRQNAAIDASARNLVSQLAAFKRQFHWAELLLLSSPLAVVAAAGAAATTGTAATAASSPVSVCHSSYRDIIITPMAVP